MSGKGERNITKTDSTAKKEKAKKLRKKTVGRRLQKTQMFISIQESHLESREFFGKKLIPMNGFLKYIVVKIPDVPMPVKLNVISELGAHERRDTFELQGGLTTLEEEVRVKAGTVLKFSVEFEGDQSLDDVYISGSLIIK